MSFDFPAATTAADPTRPMYLRREFSRSYYDYADPDVPRHRGPAGGSTVSFLRPAQQAPWEVRDEAVAPSIRMDPPQTAPYRLHPYFGVAVKSDPKPCLVTEVLPDSPAMKAGIRPGDQLLSWDGVPLTSDADWKARVSQMRVGDRVILRFERDAQTHTVPVGIEGLDPKRAPGKFPFFGLQRGDRK